MKMLSRCQMLCLCLLFYSCTTIGVADKSSIRNIDFGPPEKLRLCIYKDTSISDEQAEEIVTELQNEFSHFGLEIEVPQIIPWERPAFTSVEILNNFASCPLEAPCDRLLALVGRNIGDFLWGVVMPEVHGSVEGVTMTKGFAVAEVGSLNQIFSSGSASRLAIHETYHLLGCEHDTEPEPCYTKIRVIKKLASKNRLAGYDFFPSVGQDYRVLKSRMEVEEKLESYLDETFTCGTDIE